MITLSEKQSVISLEAGDNRLIKWLIEEENISARAIAVDNIFATSADNRIVRAVSVNGIVAFARVNVVVCYGSGIFFAVTVNEVSKSNNISTCAAQESIIGARADCDFVCTFARVEEVI